MTSKVVEPDIKINELWNVEYNFREQS